MKVQFNENRLRTQTGMLIGCMKDPKPAAPDLKPAPAGRSSKDSNPIQPVRAQAVHEHQKVFRGSIQSEPGFPAIAKSLTHAMLSGPAVTAGKGGEPGCGCRCHAGWENAVWIR